MTKVHLNSAGIKSILNSAEMKRAVEELAETVADNVRDQDITVGDVDGGSHEIDLPVKVDVYESDRARASVVLAHPAGLAVQAKHGALTKAAAEAGLEVHAVLWYTTKAGVTRRATAAQIANWTGSNR